MKGRHATLRDTNVLQNVATETHQEVASDVSRDEIEDHLDMSEDDYISASQTVYAAPENSHHMIEAILIA